MEARIYPLAARVAPEKGYPADHPLPLSFRVCVCCGDRSCNTLFRSCSGGKFTRAITSCEETTSPFFMGGQPRGPRSVGFHRMRSPCNCCSRSCLAKGQWLPTVEIGREVQIRPHERLQIGFGHAFVQPILDESAQGERRQRDIGSIRHTIASSQSRLAPPEPRE